MAEEKGIQAKWIVTHVQGGWDGVQSRSFFVLTDFYGNDGITNSTSPFLFIKFTCSNHLEQIYVVYIYI